MHDILVFSLEFDHAMNDTLLLRFIPASSFEYKMHSWYAGVALGDNRALPFRELVTLRSV